MSLANALEIKGAVPYADLLYGWLHVTHHADADQILRASHQFDVHFLAWEEVRRLRNPFFVNGTGFEGYLIGVCRSSPEALDQILAIGHQMLGSVKRLHPYSHQLRQKMFRTLMEQISDPDSIHEWADIFGATLGRLRVNLLNNPAADAFHHHTYELISRRPTIIYHENDHAINQEYAISRDDFDHRHVLFVDHRALKPNDQDAWLIMRSAGRFGHPLVRQYTRFCVN